MKDAWIERAAFLSVMIAAVPALASGQVRAHIAGEAVASFQGSPSPGQVVNTFATENQPLYWGVGFEVVGRHIGYGGLYTVDFQRSAATAWWLDWYAQAFNLSFHLFDRRTFIDPFVSVGIGSAGRVWLGPASPPVPGAYPLLLSIFPVISGGVGLDLDGFYVDAKLSYLPVISPPPVSPFENVPLGHFQVAVSGGIVLGR